MGFWKTWNSFWSNFEFDIGGHAERDNDDIAIKDNTVSSDFVTPFNAPDATNNPTDQKLYSEVQNLASSGSGNGSSYAIAGVNALSNLYSTYLTNKTNEDIADRYNELQEKWHNEDKAWQEAQTEKLWNREDQNQKLIWNREDLLRQEQYDREDTNYQRTAQDLIDAGYSPLALNGLNTSSASVSTSGNASDSLASMPSTMNPVTWQAQSAQMDLSSLIGAVTSQKNLDELIRHNKSTEQQARDELESSVAIENDKLLQQSLEFKAELDEKIREFDIGQNNWLEEFNQNASQFSEQLAQQKDFHLDELSEKDKARAYDQLQIQQKQNYSTAVDFAKSIDMPYYTKTYTSYGEYMDAMSKLKSLVVSGNRSAINSFENDSDKWLTSESFSNGETNSVSATFGNNSSKLRSSNDPDVNSSATFSDTLGLNVGASAAKGENGSWSGTYDSSALKKKLQQYYGGVLEIPVYAQSYDDWKKNYKDWK